MYDNIIEILLLIDEDETINFIESIDDVSYMSVVSAIFSEIFVHFESKELVKRIEKTIRKFKDSESYNFILDNLEYAKKALD